LVLDFSNSNSKRFLPLEKGRWLRRRRRRKGWFSGYN